MNKWPLSVSKEKCGAAKAIVLDLIEQLGEVIDELNRIFGESANSISMHFEGIQDYLDELDELLSTCESDLGDDVDKFSSQALHVYAKLDQIYRFQAYRELGGKKWEKRSVTATLKAMQSELLEYTNKDNGDEMVLKPIYQKLQVVIKEFNSNIRKLGLAAPISLNMLDGYSDINPIGVITVLEHEYQSVIRRFDSITAISNENSYGFMILKRISPKEDLKVRRKTKFPKHSPKYTGWALGVMDGKDVLVVCTGDAGEEVVRNSRKLIQRHLKNSLKIGKLPAKWAVVGVCAGTDDDNWKIGNVLISKDHIIPVRMEPKNTNGDIGWRVEESFSPIKIDLQDSLQGDIRLYRPIEKEKVDEEQCDYAINIHGVTFLCSNVVVNSDDGRKKMLQLVNEATVSKKINFSGSHIRYVGIEMEAAALGVEEVVVIKGICDFADSNKGSTWSDEDKNIKQLFAAETAAEVFRHHINEISSSNSE